MDSNQRLSTLFSLAMMVATAMLGWFTLRDGGVSRLNDNRAPSQVVADDQDVTARLWEDPLEAVQSEAGRSHPAAAVHSPSDPCAPDEPEQVPKHTLSHLAQIVQARLAQTPAPNVCILVVPIPDTPYPDDHETRLRMRYSVQMALADCNYLPASHSYLGFVRVTKADLPGASDHPGSVFPYEWFLPRRLQHAGGTGIKEIAVLVLWLPESCLDRSPLGLLDRFVEQLEIPSARLEGIFLIGPQSSDTLKSFVAVARESEKDHPAPFPSLRNKLVILSAQATAPDGMLGLQAHPSWSRARDDLANLLAGRITRGEPDTGTTARWRYFQNLIATDDQLTDLLVAELDLRNIDLAEDRILVLAEADTAYGRSLPIALQSSLDERRSLPAGALTANPVATNTPERIAEVMSRDRPASPPIAGSKVEIYRYLRGLDQQKGQPSPGDKTAPRTPAKTIDETLAVALSRQEAMALGESQMDYVDRLVRDIGGSVRLRSDIKAVGVLGGNIYDKLILLRALRPRFPDAVFFTTDLDARLWHPDHLPFTRNLVVASAADISGVPPGLNVTKIPPFRDTYQMTVFNACRVALGHATGSDLFGGVSEAALPMIFEIGRHGPAKLLGFTSREPEVVWPSLWTSNVRGVFVALLGATIALILYAVSYRNRSLPHLGFCLLGAVCIGLVVAFAIQAKYVLPAQIGGEPWSGTEGISVWPTEIMRAGIALMVVVAFLYTGHRRKGSRTDLEKDFFIGKDSPRDPARPHLAENEYVARDLYEEHVLREHGARRILRVILATGAYLMLGLGVMYWLNGGMPPNTHIRGDTARKFDFILLFSAILFFLAFVFYVLDAVFLTSQLLRKIKERTYWPSELIKKTRERFPLEGEDLDSFHDVKFAARLSAETGRLIFLPFLIQFLFILSRNSYFDHWTWPGALLAIFVGNAVLALVAWGILRHSANQIRRTALGNLQTAIRSCRPATGGEGEARRRYLRRMRKEIGQESLGAYSRIVQDPAVLAVFLPSSVFGVLAILARTLFSTS